jgi:hypothetical protein
MTQYNVMMSSVLSSNCSTILRKARSLRRKTAMRNRGERTNGCIWTTFTERRERILTCDFSFVFGVNKLLTTSITLRFRWLRKVELLFLFPALVDIPTSDSGASMVDVAGGSSISSTES